MCIETINSNQLSVGRQVYRNCVQVKFKYQRGARCIAQANRFLMQHSICQLLRNHLKWVKETIPCIEEYNGKACIRLEDLSQRIDDSGKKKNRLIGILKDSPSYGV